MLVVFFFVRLFNFINVHSQNSCICDVSVSVCLCLRFELIVYLYLWVGELGVEENKKERRKTK